LSGEKLLGCGALHFYSPVLAEIRSLAVSEQAKTLGVGRKLVGALVREAQEYELDAAFAFTYVTEFFRRSAFTWWSAARLPLKAWKDCVRCPKFQACDEIAVLRVLRPERWDAQVWQMTAPDDQSDSDPHAAAADQSRDAPPASHRRISRSALWARPPIPALLDAKLTAL
jgi:hypothetical protein